MSATGRNKKGKERREADFYPTPAWCTRAILPHLGLATKGGCSHCSIRHVVTEQFWTYSGKSLA